MKLKLTSFLILLFCMASCASSFSRRTVKRTIKMTTFNPDTIKVGVENEKVVILFQRSDVLKLFEKEQRKDPYWELKNVQESIFGGSEITSQEYLSQNWRISLSPELLGILLVDPDEHSISGLYSFAGYFEDQGLDGDVYLMAFWKKLLQPLSTLFLVILASSIVFGHLRQVSVGSRVVYSIGIALIFTISQRMLEPASLLYGFSPLLAVITPIIICGALGIYILKLVR